MPQFQPCGVIIEEYRNLKTKEGLHGECVVYERSRFSDAVAEDVEAV